MLPPRAVTLSLALSLAASAPMRALADDWWGADKAYHLAASFALAGAVYGGLALASKDGPAVRLALSASLALVPGIAKEIYDSGQPRNAFSLRDLTWDLAGVVLGVAAGLGVELAVLRLQSRRARASPRVALGVAGRGGALCWAF